MYGSNTTQRNWSSVASSRDTRGPPYFDILRDIMLLVHGDDFLVLVDEDGQKYLKGTLSEKYGFRCDGCIGPEDNQPITLLNRVVTYHQDGSVSFGAHPRRAEMIIRQLGLEGSKGISTPGEKKKLYDVVATSRLPHESREESVVYITGDESAISRTRQSRHR